MPNIYKAEAVLSPVESDSSNLSNTLSNLGGGLGALASVVHVTINLKNGRRSSYLRFLLTSFVEFIYKNDGLTRTYGFNKME